MKTILFALVLGIMGFTAHAQNTEIKIGRHGACNTGRGICGIQTQASAKNNNATFVKDSNSNLVLRLYKNKLSKAQIDMLFGKIISADSTIESLQIDQAFNLDSHTKSLLYQTTGYLLDLVQATRFNAIISEQYIDIILLKSKS